MLSKKYGKPAQAISLGKKGHLVYKQEKQNRTSFPVFTKFQNGKIMYWNTISLSIKVWKKSEQTVI